MRKALAAVGLLVFTATLVHGDKEIEPDALLGHIKFLAADDLKGRANGSERGSSRETTGAGSNHSS
jgi:hypothetical protein